jgi:crotonobetainyl-CoA:carnitine CoA-transferase CaiB-like acyl-CoA transferase
VAIDPLSGVRVVEFADRYSVGYAGKLLAELGADVVRIAKPDAAERDVTETVAVAGVRAEDARAYLHLRKRTLPWTARDAAGTLALADIVLVDDPQSVKLLATTPAQVVVCCTPFGLDGPYAGRRAYDINLSAFAGISWQVGAADGAPVANPALLGVTQAGLAAAIGAVAALLHRDRAGEGQLVDVGEYECLATVHMAGLYSLYLYGGEATRRMGRRKRGPYPFGIFRCKDGWVCMVFLRGRQWSALLAAMGSPEWAKDPRFADRRRIGYEHADQMDALIAPWLLERTRAELLALGMARGIPIGPLYRPEELRDNPQLAKRGFFDPDLALPKLPAIAESYPGPAGQLSGAVPATAAREQPGPGALAGLRVLDLGRVVAGSVVSQVMADLGADVIKVESRSHLDSAREGVPIVPELAGPMAMNLMPHFHNANRGKRSLTLDLRNDAGRSVFERLLATSDVLVENFRPGTLGRLGYSTERLQELRPGLVTVSVSAAGQSGELAALTGYATQATAMGGLDSLCQDESGETVGMVTLNFGDPAAGLFGTLLGLAGVRAQRASGAGVSFDVSMIEACAMHVGPLLGAQDRECRDGVRTDDPRLGPTGVYRSAGEDRWISVSVASPADGLALCALVGRQDLYQRYVALDGRPADAGLIAEMDGELRAWAARHDDRTAFDLLQAAGVPSAPVFTVGDLLTDPHARARGNIVDVPNELLGTVPVYGFPFRMSRTPLTIRSRAPDLGEHSLAVLAELGYTPAEIDGLRAAGALDDDATAAVSADGR